MLKKYVIDTNILVSAVLVKNSLPAKVWDIALKTGIVLRSEETEAEFIEVLRRPKLARYLVDNREKQFLDDFLDASEKIQVEERITICRDSKDNKFLEVAVNGNATHLITGDTDLMER